MSDYVKLGKPIYAFSKDNVPVARVKPGSTVVIETYDCFENQIKSSDTDIEGIDWDRINPATGPIYVEDCQPGDVLAFKIHDIDIGDQGVMVTGPELGVMGHRFESFDVKIIPIQDDKAIFNDKVHIPLNKMIGVIGVAPEGEAVSCGTPGAHGGNMDTKLITSGATLYFPVFQEGALFGLGDMHAAMGDGEVSVSGIEVEGKVTGSFQVIKNHRMKHPMVQNAEGLAMIVSAGTLDEAAKTAAEDMIDLLQPHTDLSLSELTMLMSAVGQTQISQIVDPQVTARFFVPKWLLNAYNITNFE